MSDNLLHQLRDELATSDSISFSVSLRKAMIIGSRLQSNDLTNWVHSELNRYKSSDKLPNYRQVGCSPYMNYRDRGFRFQVPNQPINLFVN